MKAGYSSNNLGRKGSQHAENVQMAAAKAKLHSLLSNVGSLGYSLVPPGEQVKRRVYGVQQKAHTPKFGKPRRKKKQTQNIDNVGSLTFCVHT